MFRIRVCSMGRTDHGPVCVCVQATRFQGVVVITRPGKVLPICVTQ